MGTINSTKTIVTSQPSSKSITFVFEVTPKVSGNTCTLQDIQEYLNLRYLLIDKGIALELANLLSYNIFEVTLF